MKVLQIVGDAPVGGGTYLILELCRHLVRQGCQVEVLSTNEPTQQLLKQIRGVEIRTEILIPRSVAFFKDARVLWQLTRFLHRERYQVVHAYSATPGFLGRIAARLAGVPVILFHQASWTVTEFTPLGRRLLFTPLEYLSTLASTRGICVSHAIVQLARRFHTAPMRRLVVIPNGIDPEPFLGNGGNAGAVRAELRISREGTLIGNTGRLSPDKDIATLVRALASLRERAPDCTFSLALAGDGPMRPGLEMLVRELGLERNVHLLGYRRDIPAILEAIDIFVTPTLREGLSISIMEAMAAAKPIVATSILPNKELIEHESTGLLVEPKSPGQIAEAVLRFVRQPELAKLCAASARQRVLDRYHIDRMLRETWDLYVDLSRVAMPNRPTR